MQNKNTFVFLVLNIDFSENDWLLIRYFTRYLNILLVFKSKKHRFRLPQF